MYIPMLVWASKSGTTSARSTISTTPMTKSITGYDERQLRVASCNSCET